MPTYQNRRVPLYKHCLRNKKICNNKTLPKHLIVYKIETNDADSIVEKFNKIFVNIGPNPSVTITLNQTALSEDEFEESFKLLKRNKAPGYDGLDINIITSVYELIKEPQLKIFNELINLGIFPENMKIAKVTPIFKSGKKELPTNYRPITVLPCFSKTLERIMYNQVHNYPNDNNLLFHKQFGFRKGHSFISF